MSFFAPRTVVYRFAHPVQFGTQDQTEVRGLNRWIHKHKPGPNDYFCQTSDLGVSFELRQGPEPRLLFVPWQNIASATHYEDAKRGRA